jgi:hypothetical protein
MLLADNAFLTTHDGVMIICGRFPGTTCRVSFDDGSTYSAYTVDVTGLQSQGTMYEVEPGVVIFIYAGQNELRQQAFRVHRNPPSFEWMSWWDDDAERVSGNGSDAAAVAVIKTDDGLAVSCAPRDAYVEIHVDPSRHAATKVMPTVVGKADGSAERPFASVHDAQRALREGLGAGCERRVLLHGHNQLSRPLLLDNRDSGSAEAPIRWMSAPSEQPARLTGGIKVPTSAFSAAVVPSGAKGVMKAALFPLGFDVASLGSFSAQSSEWASWPYPTSLAELFVDGRPMALARAPSLSQNGTWSWYGYQDFSDAQPVDGPNPYHNQTGPFVHFTLNNSNANRLLQRALDIGDVWLHGYWQFDWSDSFVKIDSIEPTSGGAMRYTRSSSTPPQYPFTDGARFVAVNNLALLDGA